MDQQPRVCESCLDAAAEEALASPEDCELLCLTLGSDIADHLCEEIELAGALRCSCLCHGRAKAQLRQSVRAGSKR
jgi:hypothetical protein